MWRKERQVGVSRKTWKDEKGVRADKGRMLGGVT